MSFHVGQKVEQIKPWADPDTGYADVHFTRCGVVYTIRETIEALNKPALLFVELRNPPRFYRNAGIVEQPFPAWNFRPVVAVRKRVSFQIGADPDSDRWDNRKKRKEKV